MIDVDPRGAESSSRTVALQKKSAARSAASCCSRSAVGQVREGVVVRLAEFGAFVDLGGVDGLIPMRELAFDGSTKRPTS